MEEELLHYDSNIIEVFDLDEKSKLIVSLELEDEKYEKKYLRFSMMCDI